MDESCVSDCSSAGNGRRVLRRHGEAGKLGCGAPGVEEDMKAASGVTMHDITSADLAQRDGFKQAIQQAQCFYRRGNPVVPVLMKDFTLTLQGTFTGQGPFCGIRCSGPAGQYRDQCGAGAAADAGASHQLHIHLVVG